MEGTCNGKLVIVVTNGRVDQAVSRLLMHVSHSLANYY